MFVRLNLNTKKAMFLNLDKVSTFQLTLVDEAEPDAEKFAVLFIRYENGDVVNNYIDEETFNNLNGGLIELLNFEQSGGFDMARQASQQQLLNEQTEEA
jgi:hypothetical protein